MRTFSPLAPPPRRAARFLLAAVLGVLGVAFAPAAAGAGGERAPERRQEPGPRGAPLADAGLPRAAAARAIPASENVEVLGNLPLCGPSQCADVWGRGELAMVARRGAGWAFVDTADPRGLRTIAAVGGGLFTQDVKVVAEGTLAVATNEVGGSGFGAVLYDVANPFAPRELARITDSVAGSVHNAFLADGFLYLASNSSRRVEIYDVRQPRSPRHVASVEDPNGRIHDMVVVDGRLYSSFLAGGFTVHDVVDPRAPLLVASHDYPAAFTHNAWPSADGRHLFTTDEVVPSGHMRVFDLGEAGGGAGPVRQVGRFVSRERAVIHNVHTAGNLVYIAYYTAGLRIVDVSEPRLPVEVAYADTSPFSTAELEGAWGVFPYTERPWVYVSDMTTGLWTIAFDGRIAAAPTGFTARATTVRAALIARTVFELSWDPHPRAAGYQVYRSDAEGILERAGTTGAATTRFVEDGEPGVARSYAVTAVLPDGTESRPTPILEVGGER